VGLRDRLFPHRREIEEMKLREYREGQIPDDLEGSLHAIKLAIRAAEMTDAGLPPLSDGSPDLYGPPFYSGNYSTVVPRLDFPSKTFDEAGEAARKNPLQFKPIWRLAMRIGALPIKVYDINPDTGVRTENLRHKAYQLLRRPNEVLTRPLLLAGMVKDMLTTGAGAWYKKRDSRGGPPIELWPIPRRALRPIRDPEEIIQGFTLNVFGAEPVRLPFEDVCYFRLMPGLDDWAIGTSPLASLAGVGDFGMSGIDAMTDLFDHAMLERIYVDLHGKELHPRNRNRLENQIANARQDRYGIPIMEDGATIESFGGRGPDQRILVDAIELAVSLITDTYGMPQKEEDLKFFYGETVQPIADAIEQELERSLMPEFEVKGSKVVSFPEFAFRQILEGDPMQRAQMHQIEILSGQRKVDEVRKDDNLPPLENGAGDVTLVPINTRELMSLEQQQQQQSQSQITTGTPTKGSTGGFGGSQGQKQDGITAPTGKQKLALPPDTSTPPSKARSAAGDARSVALGKMRDAAIQSTAARLMGRLRSVMNRDVQGIKQLSSKGAQLLPAREDAQDVIARSTVEVARHLKGYMLQIAEVANTEADALFMSDSVRAATSLSATIQQAIATRAQYVADRFTAVRTNALSELIIKAYDEDWSNAQLADAITARWGEISTGMAEGIANTELSFAHTQATLDAYKRNGVQLVDFIFGGGPCTTGMCEDVSAGGPYEAMGMGAEDIPPLHPTCGCYLVPAGLDSTV
jgi:HK97 family phage portal protein